MNLLPCGARFRSIQLLIVFLLLTLCATNARAQTLLHRYSFTTDASDSVGNAHGALAGDAVIQDGAVALNGFLPTYVELPPNLVANLTNFTFEIWLTWDGGPIWQRIFDFGTSTLGPGVPGAGLSSVCMTPSCPLTPTAGPDIGAFIQPPGNFLIYSSANLYPHPLPPGFLQHFAWTFDKTSKTSTLYLNGEKIAVNSNQNISPADVGPTDNNWLGRSQYFQDSDFKGSINEFRIYDSPLSDETVAAHYLDGPDMNGRGALAGIRLIATNLTIRAGTQQQLHLAADFENIKNLQFTTNTSVTYASSDENVLTVDENGLVTAAAGANNGSADITASYEGQTSKVAIQVTEFPAAMLLHRYSFINDASDSVGAAHGTLQGGASISNGVVVLSGNNSWVKMPTEICSGLRNLTFEFWLTWNGGSVWQRIFDFGSNRGNLGEPYGYAYNDICLVAQDGYQATDGGSYLSLIVFDNAGVQRSKVSVAPLSVGVQHQLVWTLDDLNTVARLFVDGVQMGEGIMTDTFADLGDPPNCWIAESPFHDPEFQGTIDDIRVYDNALSPQTIAAHYAAGPNDGVNTELGALKAIHIIGQTKMLSGISQTLRIFGDYQNASNILVTNGITFQVSSPVSLDLTSEGVLTAHASATTNVTVTASVSGKTDILNLQIIVPAAANLIHRYSFTTDASDSIGNAHGTLMTNAVCVGGSVIFGGVNAWAKLPANFVTNLTDLTFEFWLTWNGGGVWQHIFDFGNNIGNYGNGYGYALNDFCLVAETGFQATDGGGHLGLLTFTTPGLQHTELYAPKLSTGAEHHVVWTYNSAATTAQLFIDGVLADSNPNLVHTFSSFHDAPNCWLAASQFNDTQFNGSINEFRIYDGALSTGQVAGNFSMGPDSLSATVRISAAIDGGQLTLSWPVSASSGFVLQSANSLNTTAQWTDAGLTPTVSNDQNRVTIPIGAGTRFFRLAR